MRRPGGGSDEIAVNVRLIDSDVDERSAGEGDFRTDRGIRGRRSPLEGAGRGENLQAVANRRDRLTGVGEVTHECYYLGIES